MRCGTFVIVDGRELTAGARETILVRRGTPHALRADSTTRCLVLDAPAGHERLFLAVGRPAPHGRLPPVPEEPRMALGHLCGDRGGAHLDRGWLGITPSG